MTITKRAPLNSKIKWNGIKIKSKCNYKHTNTNINSRHGSFPIYSILVLQLMLFLLSIVVCSLLYSKELDKRKEPNATKRESGVWLVWTLCVFHEHCAAHMYIHQLQPTNQLVLIPRQQSPKTDGRTGAYQCVHSGVVVYKFDVDKILLQNISYNLQLRIF